MADEPSPSGQNDIDELFKQAQAAPAPGSGAPEADPLLSADEMSALLHATGAAASKPAASRGPRPSSSPGEMEQLLNQAEQALASVNAPAPTAEQLPLKPFTLQDLTRSPASTESATLDLIRDVELDLKIELGRTEMYLEDVLKLRKGSVVPLDKLAGDPVDIYVNGRLIARGEVLVLNDNFCVRVAELISSEGAA